jgi:nitrogen fixation protein FixH
MPKSADSCFNGGWQICRRMNSNQDNEPLGEIAHDGQPSVLNALALDGTLKVMRRFNRNTMVVASGLFGTVIFAALVLAVQEHHPWPAEVAEKTVQTSDEVLPNASPVELPEVVGLSGKKTNKMSSGQATSSDDRFTPEINHANLKANLSSASPARRHDLARATRPAIANERHRSSTRLRFAGVKIWFLTSWLHGLTRAEKSRNWTQFWNSNKERKKRVSHTAETTR